MKKNDVSLYAGQSLQERQIARYDQLIQAGIELFGLEGYHNCTVRQVCQKAELSHRYFYESFTDMEAFFLAVYARCTNDMEQYLKRMFFSLQADHSVEQLIHALLFEYYTMIEDERMVRICSIDILNISPAANKVYADKIKSFADLLNLFLSTLFADLKIDAKILEVLAISVVGSVEQSAIFWNLSQYHIPKEKMVQAQSIMISGVLTGLRNHTTQP